MFNEHFQTGGSGRQIEQISGIQKWSQMQFNDAENILWDNIFVR
jgi:hypothetical protein